MRKDREQKAKQRKETIERLLEEKTK
jgi:hypothetical protein